MKKILAVLAMCATLGACGEYVEVPPATEGKILTSNGYKPDTIPPSVFRLDPCFFLCDKLVLIDKSDNGVTETFRLFMPKDQLNVEFDLRMTLTIQDGKTDAILNRIKPTGDIITFEQVYGTYGRPIVREVVRSVISQYEINEIASSRDAVNAAVSERLRADLKTTPIQIKTAGLADIQFPEVITKQKELAAQRKIEIERQEAEKQITLIKLQTDLEAAKAQRAIRRERANAAAEENEIAAKSVTPEYLEYKKLEVLELMATNGSSVFVPFEALDDVGLSQKVFSK